MSKPSELAKLAELSQLFSADAIERAVPFNLLEQAARPVSSVDIGVAAGLLLQEFDWFLLNLNGAFGLWSEASEYSESELSVIRPEVGSSGGRIWNHATELLGHLVAVRTAFCYSKYVADESTQPAALWLGLSHLDSLEALAGAIAQRLPQIIRINREDAQGMARTISRVACQIPPCVLSLSRFIESNSDNMERMLSRLSDAIFELSMLSAELARYSSVADTVWEKVAGSVS